MIKPDHWPAKDTPEVLDYAVNWTKRLAGDTILTSDFTLLEASGLTIDQASFAGAVSQVWLRGGAPGVAEILCTVTTQSGRTMDERVLLEVLDYAGA